jgi:hypothetical protein
MVDKTNLLEKSVKTLRQRGVVELSRKAAVYLARAVAGRSNRLSNSLDFAILRDSLMREYGSVLQRNEIFRDLHAGRRCFVIGNGPSLKEQDLSPLKGELTFVTNSFYRHPVVGEAWQPSYYFLSDPCYFDDSADLSEFAQMTSRIESAPFFVPYFARDFLAKTSALPSQRTFLVAAQGGLEEELWRKKPDLTALMPGAQTVVQLAIMTAMFMGCSKIYLLGLDHDWLSHGGEHINFYSEQAIDSQPDGNLNGWQYKPLMESVLTMWEIYEKLEQLARADGITIFNATRGGFLDVFERANYEDAVIIKQ